MIQKEVPVALVLLVSSLSISGIKLLMFGALLFIAVNIPSAILLLFCSADLVYVYYQYKHFYRYLDSSSDER